MHGFRFSLMVFPLMVIHLIVFSRWIVFCPDCVSPRWGSPCGRLYNRWTGIRNGTVEWKTEWNGEYTQSIKVELATMCLGFLNI